MIIKLHAPVKGEVLNIENKSTKTGKTKLFISRWCEKDVVKKWQE